MEQNMCWFFFRSAVGGPMIWKGIGVQLTGVTPIHFCACLKPEPVSILTSSVVDRKFELQSGRQIKDSKIGSCCFSTENAA